MKEEMLIRAYKENNWESLKASLNNKETTLEQLKNVFIDADSKFPLFRRNLDSIQLPPTRLNIVMIASMKGNVDVLELLFLSKGVKSRFHSSQPNSYYGI